MCGPVVCCHVLHAYVCFICEPSDCTRLIYHTGCKNMSYDVILKILYCVAIQFPLKDFLKCHICTKMIKEEAILVAIHIKDMKLDMLYWRAERWWNGWCY